jgi:hypothetical protein
MRIAFAATGLLVVMGIGGAYALMHGQQAPRHAANVGDRIPGIPKAESARLFALSGVSTEPPRPAPALAARQAAPGGLRHDKPSAGKSTMTKTAKSKVKPTASKMAAKSKSP